jgi:hypothetical protein
MKTPCGVWDTEYRSNQGAKGPKMEVFPPHHLSVQESTEKTKDFHEQIEHMNVTDQMLEKYIEEFFSYYRDVIDRFFPRMATNIPLYSNYPFRTLVLRVGKNGIIYGYRPDRDFSIRILRPQEFDPPLTTINILAIQEIWQTPLMSFDFRIKKYDEDEARIDGIQRALEDALRSFWMTLTPQKFEMLCIEMLLSERVDLKTEVKSSPSGNYFDAVGNILLHEPAGFRRFEKWVFEFKHYPFDRFSVVTLHELEKLLEQGLETDVICLITSSDLTSLGNHIAVQNPRIRIWDSLVLNHLIHQHLEVTNHFFAEYSNALESLSQEFEKPTIEEISSASNIYKDRLDKCPPGRKHFADYEKLGTEIWEYLFYPALGKGVSQEPTHDGAQRRDVLFQNHRKTEFWGRVAERFDADFVIVDFKNYKEPITSKEVSDVAKYANQALGRFIVLVSRHGGGQIIETQIRIFRDQKTVVIVISDAHMLEMIERKDRGERPEDVLEDVLNTLLTSY